MIRTALLFANEDDGLETRLKAALAVARTHKTHLLCLQVTAVDMIFTGDPLGDDYALPIVAEQLRRQEAEHRQRVEGRLREEGVSWDWIHRDGFAAEEILAASRLADLIVLSSRRNGQNHGIRTPVDYLATHARAPLLAVPCQTQSIAMNGVALVAWNDSMEAAHALSLARPLLASASRVQLVEVKQTEDDRTSDGARAYLRRHGIASDLHLWQRDGRGVAEAILDAATTLRADFIVMGAYGHSRFAELILGGVTRAMLQQSPIPLVLAH